jgi:hypothetical protein
MHALKGSKREKLIIEISNRYYLKDKKMNIIDLFSNWEFKTIILAAFLKERKDYRENKSIIFNNYYLNKIKRRR